MIHLTTFRVKNLPARPLLLVWLAAVAGVLSGSAPPKDASIPPGFGFGPNSGSPQPAFGDSRDRVSIDVLTSQAKVAPGTDFIIAVVLNHEPGWHSWPNAGNVPAGMAAYGDAINTGIKVELPADHPLRVHSGFIQWPTAHAAKADVGEGPKDYAVFSDQAIVYVPVTVKPDAKPGHANIELLLTFQSCNDRVCEGPVYDHGVAATVEIVQQPAGTTSANQASAMFNGFDPTVWPKIHSGQAPPKFVKFDLFGLTFQVDAGGPTGLILLCMVAALGGVLLNFTPCVLPVIPIKIMSLSQSAGNRGRTLALGFSMFVGVVAFWMALGAAIASIKSFTATNQLFQYPWFTIGVGVVIAIMAIGMCGLFSIRLPNAVYMFSPKHDSAGGSFLFGIMTAILSTPCTAPFMGAAAAWAATQSPVIVLTVFFAIGFGMGLPYFILSAFPHLVQKMPRTGPASELIKQVMGLLMLAAAAYFIGVGLSGMLVHPPDPPSRLYLWMVAGLVAIAGGWLAWRTLHIAKSLPRRIVFGGLGVIVVGLAIAGGIRFTDKGPIDWIYYTPQRFAEARASGKIVVLEFTAEWCLNCKALEEAVLRHESVSSLMNLEEVAPIKIDLTGNNIDGNAMLTQVERRSIPLLVIFDREGREAFKSDFYTIDQVVQAVESARGNKIAAQ